MADVMAQASSWLEQMRVAHRSNAVRYLRKDQNILANASIGRSQFDLDDGGVGVLRIETRDYLIAASELKAGGIALPPQLGDQIVEGAWTYEVISPGGKEPHWRWDDRNRQRLRIHTALASEESS